MRPIFRTLALCSLVALAGCSDPHSMVLPRDANSFDAKTREKLQKLPESEREMVARYMIRHLIGGGGTVPEGTTVAEALVEQKGIEEAAAVREKEEAALTASVERDQAAARATLSDAVSVVLVEKTFLPADINVRRYRGETDLKVAYSNKSTKTIAGVKGTLVFKNLFGDPITRVAIAMTDAVEPGKTVVWDGSTEYNQFERKDQELAFTPVEKMKVEFEPAMVVFADGTRLGGKP
jgi:hypothetical protein